VDFPRGFQIFVNIFLLLKKTFWLVFIFFGTIGSVPNSFLVPGLGSPIRGIPKLGKKSIQIFRTRIAEVRGGPPGKKFYNQNEIRFLVPFKGIQLVSG